MTFAKIKYYLLGALVLFFALSLIQNRIQGNKIDKLKTDKERLIANVLQLTASNAQEITLSLKKDELTYKLSHERDSLAKVLKIRPKEVEKIVYRTITQRDTIKVPVEVTQTGQNFWAITDKGKCFTWEGDVYLDKDSLQVWRSSFNYENKQTELFWRKRPFNFLFIHLGKAVNYHKTESECGTTQVKEFNFIK